MLSHALEDLMQCLKLKACIQDVTSICFDKRSGIPEFEISKTKFNDSDDYAFWVPVAYRT